MERVKFKDHKLIILKKTNEEDFCNSEYYICVNCKLICFEANNGLLISSLNHFNLNQENIIYNLTCNEVVIKKLLE